MNPVVLSFLLFLLPTIGLAQSFSSSSTSGSGGTPGGANTQLQYNNAGAFGGLSTLTWDGTKFSLSAQIVNSTNGAASTPPSLLSGTWFTGGTATTTKPQFLIEPSGTTSTGWSVNGTGFGVNAPAGFTGNVIDLQKDGASFVSLTSAGTLNAFRINAAGYIQSSDVLYLVGGASAVIFGAALDLQLGRGGPAFLKLGAGDIAAPIPQKMGTQGVVAGTTNGAGANWTIQNSLSTGSGVGGDEIHTTSAANAAATTQNTGVEIFRLKASATGTNNPGRILASGQIESSGSQPTAAGAGGTCTTGAVVGGANAGTVTLTAACAATDTITLTFPTASATGWACDATDRNVPATLIQETATTTTTAVMTVAAATGATDVVQYKCTAY